MRFTIDVGKAIYGPPLLVDGTLYFNAGPEAYAVDLADGTTRWKTTFSMSGSVLPDMGNSMAYDDGKLYLLSGNADVVAFDATDGSMLWHDVRSPDETWECGYSSPIVAVFFLLPPRIR